MRGNWYMPEINFKSEKGAFLITALVVIVFIGMIALIAATLSTSENKSQLVNGEEQKAFWAAQSGLEYALKQIVKADTLVEWAQENIDTGENTTSKVEVKLIAPNTVQVISWGKSTRYIKQLSTIISALDSSNVANFAVYSTNSVTDVVTRDSASGDFNSDLIFQYAPDFPYFDSDELKQMAQDAGLYFAGDLTVNPSFSPPPGSIVFVEGKLRFVQGNWEGGIHFVAMGDVIFNPSWKNSASVKMTVYQPNPDAQVYIQPDQGANQSGPVNFSIDNGQVVPSESYAAEFTVVGSAINYSGWYDMPVTVKCNVEDDTYSPFGSFEKAVNGNVNDQSNPRVYVFPNIYPPNTPISIDARSWIKKWFWYSGTKNKHWMPYMTVNSADALPYVKVLRDGDGVPAIPGFLNQNSIEDYLQPYVNSNTGKISLEENQAIYLFELGTTDLNSPAADFQDLVALVSLAKDPGDFNNGGGITGNNNQVTYLTFNGGIITQGQVDGTFSPNGNGNATKTLEIIHDRKLLKDFLSLSVNGGPRVILGAKWTAVN